MRVGDVLVSVDGKSVQGATLTTALAVIETARRRVRESYVVMGQAGTAVMVVEEGAAKLGSGFLLCGNGIFRL